MQGLKCKYDFAECYMVSDPLQMKGHEAILLSGRIPYKVA